MQLVDELSMIYTTCIMVYATFAYRQTRLYSQVLCIFLVALALFITLFYHYLQDPRFHQNMYALLTAVVLFRSMYVMEVSIRPSLRHKRKEKENLVVKGVPDDHERVRENDRDVQILIDMWSLVACGLALFLGGFTIWKLDNDYCTNLRRWRREAGLPWGILLEGHGWW